MLLFLTYNLVCRASLPYSFVEHDNADIFEHHLVRELISNIETDQYVVDIIQELSQAILTYFRPGRWWAVDR